MLSPSLEAAKTNEQDVVVEVQTGYVKVQGQSVMVRVVAELTVYVLPP